MKFMNENEFNNIKNNLDAHNIELLYNNYKILMKKKLKQYKLLNYEEREYCCGVAFTKMLNKEDISKLSKNDFERYLWNYCKSEGWHFQRSLNSQTATFWRENNPSSLDEQYANDDGRVKHYIIEPVSKDNVEEDVITRSIFDDINMVLQHYKHKKAVECFKMFYMEGLTLDEISEIQNIKRKSAQDFIYGVRKFVRQKMVECV